MCLGGSARALPLSRTRGSSSDDGDDHPWMRASRSALLSHLSLIAMCVRVCARQGVGERLALLLHREEQAPDLTRPLCAPSCNHSSPNLINYYFRARDLLARPNLSSRIKRLPIARAQTDGTKLAALSRVPVTPTPPTSSHKHTHPACARLRPAASQLPRTRERARAQREHKKRAAPRTWRPMSTAAASCTQSALGPSGPCWT